jgi:hypothetical protein
MQTNEGKRNKNAQTQNFMKLMLKKIHKSNQKPETCRKIKQSVLFWRVIEVQRD